MPETYKRSKALGKVLGRKETQKIKKGKLQAEQILGWDLCFAIFEECEVCTFFTSMEACSERYLRSCHIIVIVFFFCVLEAGLLGILRHLPKKQSVT